MITNHSKKKVICKNKKLLKNPVSKAVGLMFSKKLKDLGMVFIMSKPRRIDLHMFFVFFPIDVLFLDQDNKVVEKIENFKPFNIYFSKYPAKFVIELPSGLIKKTSTEVGDVVVF